ncbi:unnamed protein product [Linum trigynum]|uniref:Uncharacterized protein n=1 Tax=Linum trigynum TaxID=586398 RepID=A0AAV2G2L8_9ROSI
MHAVSPPRIIMNFAVDRRPQEGPPLVVGMHRWRPTAVGVATTICALLITLIGIALNLIASPVATVTRWNVYKFVPRHLHRSSY